MGLKLARVLEGAKESEYSNSAPFIKAVEAMAKKLAGNWIPDFDRMSGSLSWGKKGSKWSFYATPNWDGADNTPVNVQFDSDDVEGHGGHKIAFSLDLKKSPEENAASYIAHVVVPTINDIERGKYGKKESKLRLGAVLGEATDPVAGWIPVTDKIMKHLYFKVSGKLADNKIACAWRGNGSGYAVVAPSDAERAKALVAGVLYLDKHESKLRLNQVLSEEDMTPGIGDKVGRPDLGAYGKDAAKYVRKRKAEGETPLGKSAVRGLRAAIKSAEEDMTPEIGKKMGRPDLGAYGRRKGEAASYGLGGGVATGDQPDIKKLASDLAYKLNLRNGDTTSVKAIKDALKGNWDNPTLNKIKQAFSSVGIKVTEVRHSALEDAIKQASDMLKPRRDAKGRLILVGEEAELKSAPEYAALVFDFMKKKGNAFDAKAWQEAVDVKGVGVPMHLWSVVKGLVQKMFLGEV